MEKLFWHLLPQNLIKLDCIHTKSHPRWKPGSSEVDILKSIYTLSPGKDFIIQALLPRSVHIGPLSWFLVRLFLNWLGISSERSRKTKIKKKLGLNKTMPKLFRLKLVQSCDIKIYQVSDLFFCLKKSPSILKARGTLPRNGSNFLDSVPHIRQLTSFWRMPPNIAVTTVDAPFLDKPHQR